MTFFKRLASNCIVPGGSLIKPEDIPGLKIKSYCRVCDLFLSMGVAEYKAHKSGGSWECNGNPFVKVFRTCLTCQAFTLYTNKRFVLLENNKGPFVTPNMYLASVHTRDGGLCDDIGTRRSLEELECRLF